jgi:hypothetical protein
VSNDVHCLDPEDLDPGTAMLLDAVRRLERRVAELEDRLWEVALHSDCETDPREVAERLAPVIVEMLEGVA